jgi:alanyl-tRNA synthetase
MYVNTIITTPQEAIKLGALAHFEDRYANFAKTARMVDIGGLSKEVCGGTHVFNTSEIEVVKLMPLQSKGNGM